MKLKNNGEFDEELADLFEEATENAYITILSQHPEESFYIFMFHFDQKLHARVSTFSTQALERAFEEQEITDEREKKWYRVGGVIALCAAYGYTERLTELDKILDKRAAEMYGDSTELLQKFLGFNGTLKVNDEELTDLIVGKKEFDIRMNSAIEAVSRLRNRELFGTNSRCVWSRVGPEDLNEVFKRMYRRMDQMEREQKNTKFLVMVMCDSDSRNPMMPDWFAEA